MKKLVSVLLLLFCGLSVWARGVWKLTYDQMVQLQLENNYETGFVLDEDLYDFVVSVWYRYFPEHARKYGVPFICGYKVTYSETSFNATAHNNAVWNDDFTFDIITIMATACDNGFTAKEYFKPVLAKKDYNNKYCIELVAHELCHMIVSLELPELLVDEHPGHSNPVFIREANRLMCDYNLDVGFY